MTNEWTKEIETLRARNAALEAAVAPIVAEPGLRHFTFADVDRLTKAVRDAVRGVAQPVPDCARVVWLDKVPGPTGVATVTLSWPYPTPYGLEFVARADVDAVVSAAVAAERTRIRARVEVMERHREGATSLGGDGLGTHPDGEWIYRDDVLSAIGATEGGAP